MGLTQSGPQAKRHSFKRFFDDLLWVLAVGQLILVLISALIFLPQPHYIPALFVHFRFHYLLISLAILLVFILKRNKIVIAAAAIAIVLNLVAIVPYYIKPASRQSAQIAGPLTVMVSNVYTANQNKELLLRQVKDEAPDIIVLTEIDSRWTKSFEQIDDTYPFNFLYPEDNNNFGIGIYSKHPITAAERIKPPGLFPESLHAKISYAGQKIDLIATHPVPPVDALQFDLRNSQLTFIEQFIHELKPTNLIVAGDLNITPWSAYFTAFLAGSELHDIRKGYGYQSTWPTHIKILSVPLDYILTGSTFSVQGFKTLRVKGSDHKAVISVLSIH